MNTTPVNVFWFRRDLRLQDNTALAAALNAGLPVLPIFIFDDEILSELPKNDARVTFIHEQLEQIDQELKALNSSLLVLHGTVQEQWKSLIEKYRIQNVFANRDYEPYARQRDAEVKDLLQAESIPFHSFKDQVIFEENEITKDNGEFYSVYTPYKNKWLGSFTLEHIQAHNGNGEFFQCSQSFPELSEIGFERSSIQVLPYSLTCLKGYAERRDFPIDDHTSHLSVHLRFGTVSVREIFRLLKKEDLVFKQELIWREFFMQILYHNPRVKTENFRRKYDAVPWINDPQDFERWKNGTTGYSLVDAGMRELNATGYMHNRVRMVVASFLCKHLLTDWRLGEAYFAEKLLDYDLSANNGNWQWAAGTGCDAAPYFRVFNPTEQIKKFDRELKYVRKWVKDFDSLTYPQPIVEHKMARNRAIESYKKALTET